MWLQQFIKIMFLLLPYERKMSWSFILVIFIELSNNYIATILMSVTLINVLWTLIVLRHSRTVQSLLFSTSIFAFNQLVNILQVATITLSYLLFLLMILVQNLQLSNNHIKTWVWKSTNMKSLTLKVLWDLCNVNDILMWLIFVQCRPGSHMLSLICYE